MSHPALQPEPASPAAAEVVAEQKLAGGAAPGASGADPSAPSCGDATPAPVDLAEESVAGEEDPGAALDLLWPPPVARP